MLNTLMILSFRTDKPGQIRVYTVCSTVCTVILVPYSLFLLSVFILCFSYYVSPYFVNFR